MTEPCPICQYHWNQVVLPGGEHNRNCPHADDLEKGCVCQSCLQRYKVDINIPDNLWRRITNEPTRGERLLCGTCILGRIEALDEFGAWDLRRTL